VSRKKGEAIPKSQRKKPAAQEPRPVGRPTDYRPEFARQAEALSKLGATEVEIADFFQINVLTIWYWKRRHPEFVNALKLGKDGPDDRVEQSLFHKATGYSFDSEEIHIIDGEVVRVPVRKHVPPDTTACIYWTKNRRPDQWRERRNEDEGTGGNGGIQISGGFSGTIVVKATNGNQVPDSAPEPTSSVPGISEES